MLAYPKNIYILHTVDIWYNVIIPEPSLIFYVIVIITCDRCDIVLNPNYKSKK